MHQYLPVQNPLVPYVFPEIKKILNSDIELPTYNTRYDVLNGFRNEILHWLQQGNKTKISGLDRFKYCYVINGSSQYINDLAKIEKRNIEMHVNEYVAYKKLLDMYNIPFTEHDDYKTMGMNDENLVIVSYPCSVTGSKNADAEDLIKNSKSKITLDSVFLGTNLFPITFDFNELSNVETFLFSFSKAFGMTYHRLGVMFTDKYIEEYDLYHYHGYANVVACQYARKIMESYGIDYFTDKYAQIYHEACDLMACDIGDCIMVGLNPDNNDLERKVKVTHLFDDLI